MEHLGSGEEVSWGNDSAWCPLSGAKYNPTEISIQNGLVQLRIKRYPKTLKEGRASCRYDRGKSISANKRWDG